MKTLLSTKEKSLNCTDSDGRTLLHLAVRHGQTHAVALLVQEGGAPINRANKAGETPLHQACQYGRMNIIRFLLDHGAGVNLGDGKGNTPLHVAAVKNKKDVAQALLEYGAAMDSRNGWVASLQTPGDLADQLGYSGMSQLLHQFVGAGATSTDERIMEDSRAIELENEFAFGAASLDPQALVVPLVKQTRSLAQSTGGAPPRHGCSNVRARGGHCPVERGRGTCLPRRESRAAPAETEQGRSGTRGLKSRLPLPFDVEVDEALHDRLPHGGDPLVARQCGSDDAVQQLVLWRRRQANSKWEVVSKNEYSIHLGRIFNALARRTAVPDHDVARSFEAASTQRCTTGERSHFR